MNRRLRNVLMEWIGTPYRVGRSSKYGADCVGFVASVLDELYGFENPKKRPVRPQDVSLHSETGGLEVVMFFKRRYPNNKISPGEIHPGDLILCKVGLAANHICIVGYEPNTVWHCTEGIGVIKTGFGALRNTMYGYRLLEKETWI